MSHSVKEEISNHLREIQTYLATEQQAVKSSFLQIAIALNVRKLEGMIVY
jgi:hypothetical protein